MLIFLTEDVCEDTYIFFDDFNCNIPYILEWCQKDKNTAKKK